MNRFSKTRPSDGADDAPAVRRWSWRGVVLAVLGAVTLGVAVLSVVVSYSILEPRFGGWAYAIVGALDALWVVFQGAEILAGNNRRRAARAQRAGIVLTAVLTAMPTTDLIINGDGRFELAMVLTPLAIVATKVAWWLTLPSLGRRVSETTRRKLADKRQRVADQLEEMEAEAAHRIELLAVATDLEKQVANAETAYRKAVLKSRQRTAEKLHDQAEATGATLTEKPLPAFVSAIRLPELGAWDPAALPGTELPQGGTQVTALPPSPGTQDGTEGVPGDGAAARTAALADLAYVAGVPVPVPGEQVTDSQMDVVLRHLRYSDDPPLSYRQARDQYREAGFVGSEERIRRVWGDLLAKEEDGPARSSSSSAPSEGTEDEEEPEHGRAS
ncbi:coiled-coil domain-containing protein [Streptomyces sp. NPDC057271]|uniref:coiled-coil domain-containing protein n=1 Tax=unclassified Streptomyces TaxID=2593676 RepID=UPI0036269614